MFKHAHKGLLHVQPGVWRLFSLFEKPWLMFKLKRLVTRLRLHCTIMSDGCWVIVYSSEVKIKQSRTLLPRTCESSLPMTGMNFHANIARGKCFSDILQKLWQADKKLQICQKRAGCDSRLVIMPVTTNTSRFLLVHCSCIFIIHKKNQNIYLCFLHY